MNISKIFKNIYNEFIYGGHLLSLGGSATLVSIMLIMKVEISFVLLVIGYLILQVIYLYNHFKERDTDISGNPERVRHLQKMEKIVPYLLFIYLFLLIFFTFLTNYTNWLFLFFLLAGGILFTKKFKNFTKKIPCFKNIYTAFFWAIAWTLIPFFHYSNSFSFLFFFLFFSFAFLRLFLNTIFFDLKDIKDDRKENLKTLPVLLGKRKTIYFLFVLNFISILPIIIGVWLGIFPYYSISLVALFLYTVYYLIKGFKADKKRIRFLSYILVDGEYLIWPFLIIIYKILT